MLLHPLPLPCFRGSREGSSCGETEARKGARWRSVTSLLAGTRQMWPSRDRHGAWSATRLSAAFLLPFQGNKPRLTLDGFHTCPTHLISSKALHITGLDYGTDITWAATITEGSRERHGVFPGRLHAAVHSWLKASSIRSCLKTLTTGKIRAPSPSNGTSAQDL